MQPLEQELHVHTVRASGGEETRLAVKDLTTDKLESPRHGV
jgi:hypothetical protein